MSLDVQHDPARRQFTIEVDGHSAEIDYRLAGAVMTITHTGVPAAIGGRGIAAQLTRAALDLARAQGWTVVPACSYAAAYMERHPEYDDLRVSP